MSDSGVPAAAAHVTLVAVLVGAALGSAGGTAVALASADVGTAGGQFRAQSDTLRSQSVDNESGVQHENPDELSQPGDLWMLQGWLSRNMGDVLVDCSTGIAVGSYNLCERLDGAYPEWLSRYVTLAEETEDGRDNTASEGFSRARDDQQQFAEQVREFRETRAAFERARRNGEEARARRLARELRRLGDDINATGRALLGDYQLIENSTGVSLQQAERTVRRLTTNLTATSVTIADEQFSPATLAVRLASQRISFVEPLSVQGQLAAANGTPLADRTVVLEIGGRERRTRTTESGAFTLRYRPVTLPLDTETATVRFAPAPESVYSGASATRSVTVAQVEGAITLNTTPATAGFGDSVAATGTVTVGERGLVDVPVSLTLAGTPAGTPNTTAGGQFNTTTRLPLSVPPGTQSVRASLPFEGRAVTAPPAASSITVERTPTRLSVAGEQVDGRELVVRGRLTTADGTPVGNRVVALRVDNRTVATVETAADGRYATTVAVPRERFETAAGQPNATVVITSRFGAGDTNLDPATAATAVPVQLPRRTTVGGAVAAVLGGIVAPVASVVGSVVAPVASVVGSVVAPVASVVGGIVDTGTAAIQTAAWWEWLLLLVVVAAAGRLFQYLEGPERLRAIIDRWGPRLSRGVRAVGTRIAVVTRVVHPLVRVTRDVRRRTLQVLGVERLRATIGRWSPRLSRGVEALGSRISVVGRFVYPLVRIARGVRRRTVRWFGAVVAPVMRVYRAVRGLGTTDAPGSERPPDSGVETPLPEQNRDPDADDVARDPLAAARECLATGDADQAIVSAYATVRSAMDHDIEEGAVMTHWEFVAACRTDGVGADSIEALEALTEAYEVAAFAPRGVEADTAEQAVGAAAELLA